MTYDKRVLTHTFTPFALAKSSVVEWCFFRALGPPLPSEFVITFGQDFLWGEIWLSEDIAKLVGDKC